MRRVPIIAAALLALATALPCAAQQAPAVFLDASGAIRLRTGQGTVVLGRYTGGVLSLSPGLLTASDTVRAVSTGQGINVMMQPSDGSNVAFIGTATNHDVLLLANYQVRMRLYRAGGVAVGGGADPGTDGLAVPGPVKAGSYAANGVSGVSCSAGSVSAATMVVTNGIVTHC